MPIFDQGYQHWQGRLTGHAWRWLTISRHGVRTHLRNRWVRLVVLFALFPALVLAAFLCIWGLIEQKTNQALLQMLPFLPDAIKNAPREFRVPIWTLAYDYFFQVEMFFIMILVVIVGPGLISQDLRFNALPLYFSKPLRRIDYFVGKLGVIGFYLGAVAVVPAVFAYVLGLGFSLDLGVVRDTGGVLLGSIGYGVVIMLSAGTLMLAMSALSRNSLYVGAIWVGIWLISGAAGSILSETVRADWCPLASYTANLQRIGQALLGTDIAEKRIRDTMLPPEAAVAVSQIQGPRQSGKGGAAPPRPHRGRGPGGVEQQQHRPSPRWYWCAGVLLGLFGLSSWILTTRVKSLDRLK
jgi:ABC-2 type transport system permease protein